MPQCKGTKKNGAECRLPAVDDDEFCRFHRFTPIIVKVQCNAIANHKHRCKHFTIQGLKCHQHLDKFQHLRVKKSIIPGAKLGLFATKPFATGEEIVEYSGPRIVSHNPEFGDDYTLQVRKHPPTFIDSRASNNEVGRFANARLRANRLGENNSQLNFNPRTLKAYLRSTKPIPKGEEITTAYGAQYWQRIRERANAAH